MSDEFPAILQKGENVLTQKQTAALAGSKLSAQPTINITMNNSTGTDFGVKTTQNWDDKKHILDVVMTAGSQSPNFRSFLKGAVS
jgi:hypothetical protein